MWLGGYRAERHHVYFGLNKATVHAATRNSPAYRKTQANNIFAPGLLKANTTYYWRLDAVKDTSIIRGHVWSFTTGSELGNDSEDTK